MSGGLASLFACKAMQGLIEVLSEAEEVLSEAYATSFVLKTSTAWQKQRRVLTRVFQTGLACPVTWFGKCDWLKNYDHGNDQINLTR